MRETGGQPAEQVACPAADVEDALWRWLAGQRQVRGTVGDLVVQLAEPARVIASRALVERCDITIRRHT
jgi:hypothetical protein